MKRNVLWLLSTITVVVLLFGYHTSTSGALSTSGTVLSSSAPPGRASAASGQGGSGSGGGNGGNQAKGTTKGTANGSAGTGSNGGTSGGTATAPPTTRTVTGGVAQTQWGPVQVQLTIKGGTITHVSLLQYPSGNPQDDQINSYALPILIQNTLNAQSAQIDMVSGATVTSTGYVQSLQSALDQAGL